METQLCRVLASAPHDAEDVGKRQLAAAHGVGSGALEFLDRCAGLQKRQQGRVRWIHGGDASIADRFANNAGRGSNRGSAAISLPFPYSIPFLFPVGYT